MTEEQGDVIQSVLMESVNLLIYIRPGKCGYNLAGYPAGGSQMLGG